MSATLVNVETQEKIPLGDNTLIGRLPSCQVHIQDGRISRQHAMIRRQSDGGYWVYDLGSSNGSFLNERRVVRTEKLNKGDTIRVSRFAFTFDAEDEEEGHEEEETHLDATITEIRTLPVIIIVSDIKGFTTLSEKLPPERLAKTIGTWYAKCENILGKHGATLDKFIGDAFLAYWMDVSPETCKLSLQVAHKIQEACREIEVKNADVFRPLGVKLEIGTSLHVGKVAQGAMGRDTFTLLGDTVNTAFRLESLTRVVKKDVLVSRDFLASWKEGRLFCQPEGEHLVKGRKEPVEVFSVKKFPDPL